MVGPGYEARATRLRDPGRGKRQAQGLQLSSSSGSGNPLKGKSASSFQHTLKPEDACPGPPISDWPLTVPQVGVGEVEGPDEAREGVLC